MLEVYVKSCVHVHVTVRTLYSGAGSFWFVVPLNETVLMFTDLSEYSSGSLLDCWPQLVFVTGNVPISPVCKRSVDWGRSYTISAWLVNLWHSSVFSAKWFIWVLGKDNAKKKKKKNPLCLLEHTTIQHGVTKCKRAHYSMVRYNTNEHTTIQPGILQYK